MAKDDQKPVQVPYKRGAKGLEEEKAGRNRDLDPQLVWRGKDEQDWSNLVVQAPPLFIQEKVHPKVLIEDLLRRTQEEDVAPLLFGDLCADSGKRPTLAASQVPSGGPSELPGLPPAWHDSPIPPCHTEAYALERDWLLYCRAATLDHRVNGRLPANMVGRHWRLHREAMEAWLRKDAK